MRNPIRATLIMSAIGLFVCVSLLAFAQDKAQDAQPVPPSRTDQADPAQAVDEPRSDRVRLRMEALEQLAGTHTFKVEIKAPTETDAPFVVLVNGEPVDRGTAFLLMRLIRARAQGDPSHGEAQGDRSEFSGHRGDERDGPRSGRPGFRGDDRDNRRWIEIELRKDEMSLEFIDTVLLVVRDFEPQMYGSLIEMQEGNEPRFETQMRRFAYRYGEEVEMKHANPEAYDLRVEDRRLEDQVKQIEFGLAMAQELTTEDINEGREQLRAIFARRFAIEIEMKGRDLQRMADRVQELITRLDTERTKQSENVEKRVDRIIEDIMSNR